MFGEGEGDGDGEEEKKKKEGRGGVNMQDLANGLRMKMEGGTYLLPHGRFHCCCYERIRGYGSEFSAIDNSPSSTTLRLPPGATEGKTTARYNVDLLQLLAYANGQFVEVLVLFSNMEDILRNAEKSPMVCIGASSKKIRTCRRGPIRLVEKGLSLLDTVAWSTSTPEETILLRQLTHPYATSLRLLTIKYRERSSG